MSMCVHNSTEALELLCSSQRIVDDITAALSNRSHTGDTAPLCIVVRAWIEIPHWAEFRGFVTRRQLNAVSQYAKSERFPVVIRHCDLLAQRMTQFFNEQIALKLHIPHTVIDFAFCVPDNATPEERRRYLQGEELTETEVNAMVLQVLELNPFSLSSSASLFSWVADEQLLKQGPFQLRILK
eukprot:TRINITY_DN2707_c0_g1_i2.p1 TRINITY_DN2707_c0_g1~~TRINITY_DN2707_c0_g1_i2.p1  ORF type:complete len:183 (+),score=41.57 TRINITY_DN2707_c0_g1_i2:971-1519(+)